MFSAEPVVTAACVFFCRRAMGAASARHSLRPLPGEGETNSRPRTQWRRETVATRLDVVPGKVGVAQRLPSADPDPITTGRCGQAAMERLVCPKLQPRSMGPGSAPGCRDATPGLPGTTAERLAAVECLDAGSADRTRIAPRLPANRFAKSPQRFTHVSMCPFSD